MQRFIVLIPGLWPRLPRDNVDTDQIIPKQFLKRIERTGYGDVLFFDWRYDRDGNPDRAFPLNAPQYRGATILLAGKNFGCGSSREHAVGRCATTGSARSSHRRSQTSLPTIA